jgi:TorA maturation chaperone TorD
VELARRLLVWAQAYGACARLLVQDAVDRSVVEQLRDVLARAEWGDAAVHAEALAELLGHEPERLEDDYNRLFVRGVVPPYETSHGQTADGAPVPGGNPQRLADIAGFYRAFGFEARGERPDHLACLLEFVALLCVKEAHARLTGQGEAAAVCSDARAAFLDEHLRPWLPVFAARVAESGAHPALALLPRLVAALVDADAGAAACPAGTM